MSVTRRLTISLGLALALALSAGEAPADPDGSFIDGEGNWRSFDREYAAWIEYRAPRYLRAAAEVTLLTGIGTLYYLGDPLSTETDFDDPSLIDKLTFRAVSFDNNLTSTNFILHPLAGSIMYGVSRINGLEFYEAFAYTALASIAFEFFLEYREKASINDLIFTPFGGMALGEFFHQLGNYVTSAPGRGGLGNRVAALTLGLPQTLHRRIDGTQLPRTGLPPDALGFSEAYAHRFAAGYGLGLLANDEEETALVHSLELRGELAAIPGFLRSGRFDLNFDEGNFTDGYLRFLLDAGGLKEVDARVSALMFGYYAQDLDGRGGFAQAIGLGSGVRYYDSWRLERRDGYAFVRLLEPMLLVWMRSGRMRGQGRAELSLDFAGIRPLAYPEWSEQFGSDGVKSVLTRQGYVFAGCASGRLGLAGSYEFFGLGGGLDLAYCGSIQGLDREQADVTRDVSSGDLVFEVGGWLALRPYDGLELRLEIEERIRQGSMDLVQVDSSDLRAGGVISYVF